MNEPAAPAATWRVTLAADADAPSRARAFLQECPCARDLTGILDDALLLLTELVTNAVRYGTPPIVVQVTCPQPDRLHVRLDLPRQGQLHIGVRDGSRSVPVRREPDLLDEGGRGIALVAMLADSWGIDPEPGPGPTGHSGPEGKTVWFELEG